MHTWQLVARVVHTMAFFGLVLEGVCWRSTSKELAVVAHAVVVQIVQPAVVFPLCYPTAWLRRPVQLRGALTAWELYGSLTAWEGQAVQWWVAERADSLARQYSGWVQRGLTAWTGSTVAAWLRHLQYCLAAWAGSTAAGQICFNAPSSWCFVSTRVM